MCRLNRKMCETRHLFLLLFLLHISLGETKPSSLRPRPPAHHVQHVTQRGCPRGTFPAFREVGPQRSWRAKRLRMLCLNPSARDEFRKQQGSNSTDASALGEKMGRITKGARELVFGKKERMPTRQNQRSYVSDLAQFTQGRSETFICVADRTEDSSYFSFGYRFLVSFTAYLLFPVAQRLLAPSIEGLNVDDITSSVTGEFAPVMDVLYALLASNTIAKLQARQEKIQEAVNAEICELRILTWLVLQLANDFQGLTRFECRKLLVPIWQHTDMLVYSSRFDELSLMLSDDLFFIVHHTLRDLQSASDKVTNPDRKERIKQISSEAADHTEKLLALRAERLDTEGQGVPPSIFAILDTLSVYILASYCLLSASREIEPMAQIVRPTSVSSLAFNIAEWTQQQVDALAATSDLHPTSWGFEGIWPVNGEALLFSLMTSMLIVVRNLYRDLERPFRGHSRIRRTVSTASLYAVRSEIESVFAEEGLCQLLREVRSNSLMQAKARAKRAERSGLRGEMPESNDSKGAQAQRGNLAWDGMNTRRSLLSRGRKAPRFNMTKL
mmetsp:Transcript_20147/g.49401  ORF Transcript_20147/g.49401 Transcript_20147/m.49401 type:complete len:557 (-) Transcript_20147:259-1929(-)